MESRMKMLRVALFLDGEGEPIAAELRSSLACRNFESEIFLFPISSILRPTPDFIEALRSLSLTHAFMLPHPQVDWDQRTPQLFQNAWKVLQDGVATVFQATIPLPLDKLSGMYEQDEESSYGIFRKYNELFTKTNEESFIQIADVDRLASEYGRSRWLDSRAWEIAGLPAGLEALSILANYFAQVITATQGDIVKMVVVDLDQILWPEVLDEVGPEGILKSTSSGLFLKFQQYLLALKKRGILLAVLSSNQSDNVMAVFEKCSRLLLKVEDFLHLELGWDNKAQGILKISERTRIDPSNMLLIDDSVMNQNLIRKFVPEVRVLGATTDPLHNIDQLNRGNFFEGTHHTRENALRVVRRAPESEEVREFLSTLDPQLEIRNATPGDVPRIAQLHQRTNQFNLRSRRCSPAQIIASLKDLLVLSFRDKDQDYGIVGVVQLVQSSDAVVIYDWLLSCRVFSRNIEETFINWLRSRRTFNSKQMRGELIRCERNKFIHRLYDRLGFTLEGQNFEVEIWKGENVSPQKSAMRVSDLTEME